jgi:PAS domain S-box-containing protein
MIGTSIPNSAESGLRPLAIEEYKLALDSASDHITITDAHGIILYANRAIERTTGFSPEEVVGKKAGSRELWGGLMDRAFYDRLWTTVIRDRQSFVSELRNRRKDGTVYDASATISPILGSSGEVEYLIGIERDITHEKELERAKSAFVSLASHQLRTPPTAVSWIAERLLRERFGPISEEQRSAITSMRDTNRRMISILDALLNVSRIELGTFSITPQEHDGCSMLSSAVEEARPIALGRGVDLRFHCPGESVVFPIDEPLFLMAFGNVLSNALRYTPREGTVDVTCQRVSERTTFGGRAIAPGRWVVSVADTGFGIPSQAQSHVFSKFYRADNVRMQFADGTGLGLYVARSIVEHSGGEIWFTSREGHGTTFFIALPLSGMEPRSGPHQLVPMEMLSLSVTQDSSGDIPKDG